MWIWKAWALPKGAGHVSVALSLQFRASALAQGRRAGATFSSVWAIQLKTDSCASQCFHWAFVTSGQGTATKLVTNLLPGGCQAQLALRTPPPSVGCHRTQRVRIPSNSRATILLRCDHQKEIEKSLA